MSFDPNREPDSLLDAFTETARRAHKILGGKIEAEEVLLDVVRVYSNSRKPSLDGRMNPEDFLSSVAEELGSEAYQERLDVIAGKIPPADNIPVAA